MEPTRQDLVEFYNATYMAHPLIWEHWWRDDNVCGALMKYPTPRHILDLGCGNGHTLEYLRTYFPEAQLYGLDISDNAIRLAEVRNPNATFFCGMFQEMELPRQFDRIVSLGVMEHLYDTVESLAKVKSHLTDGGLFYLEVPDNVYGGSEGWFHSYVGTQVEWHLSRATWEERIDAAGLEIVEYLDLQGAGFTWVLK